MAPRQPPRSRARPAKMRVPKGRGTAPRKTASDDDFPGERIAKVIARSGLGSRREAEAWIEQGRVSVNRTVIDSPALNVTDADSIAVDGRPLPARERTRLWLYHKPKGLVTTESDPEGRPTVFESLPRRLPRVLSVGRLDINTEGLLLLTNDGGLKRVLELPATGWLRRYKVRAWGDITPDRLLALENGIEVDGVQYGPIEARIERRVGENIWLIVGIREGKNREVKNVLGSLGLDVNRLIRLSYGPFQLGDLREGDVEEVPRRVLRDQLGPRVAEEAGVDFEAATDAESGQSRRPSASDAAAARTRRPPSDTPNPRRATAKAERFARMQDDGAAEPQDTEAMSNENDDTPDVELDPETGKITLKPKTVEDRKGRKIGVEKRYDPDRAPKRRPRVFGEDGKEMAERRPAPRRDDGEERPRPRRDDKDKPRTHSFREDRRPAAPASGDGLRRRTPRGDAPSGDRPEGGRDRGYKSFGARDRGDRPDRGGEGGPRKSFGYKPRDGAPSGGGFRPREDREGGGDRPERRPYRPREEAAGDRPQRTFRPREDRGPPSGDRPQRTYRPREDREGGGDDRPARRPYRPREEGAGGGDRPQRTFRPREDRGPPSGDRPQRTYRPREDREGGGGDRPQRTFRPREEREGGGGDRPQRTFRPREDRGPPSGDRPQRTYRPREEREGGGGGDRPQRTYRPREDREGGGGGGDRPQRSFKPREDRGPPSGDRPLRTYRPREDREGGGGGGDRPQRTFRPREDRGPPSGDRPQRTYRPREDREGGGDDRPARSGTRQRVTRPDRAPWADRPEPPGDDRPKRPSRPRPEGGGFGGGGRSGGGGGRPGGGGGRPGGGPPRRPRRDD